MSDLPQRITLCSQGADVVSAADTSERLVPSTKAVMPFVAFVESLDFHGLDLVRDRDCGRDVIV